MKKTALLPNIDVNYYYRDNRLIILMNITCFHLRLIEGNPQKTKRQTFPLGYGKIRRGNFYSPLKFWSPHETRFMVWSGNAEGAALAGYRGLAVAIKRCRWRCCEVMRSLLNKTSGGEIVVVIEIDDAPMLYIGENVGIGGDAVNIAVDPGEGTRMTAMGQSNALAVWLR